MRENKRFSFEQETAVENIITDQQKLQSKERERAYYNLRPPQFLHWRGSILFNMDPKLVYTDKLQKYGESHGFERKNEFHITVVGDQNGKLIRGVLKSLPKAEQEVKIKQIYALIKSTDWNIASAPQLWRITKQYESANPEGQTETRESIIQTVTFKPLDEFYARLSAIVGHQISPQFPHLTLFSKSTDAQNSQKGISLKSEEDFKKYNPEPVILK